MDEVLAADRVLVFAAGLDFRGAVDLVAGGSLGCLAPGFDAALVEAGGELLDELPDVVAIRPGQCAATAGPAGLEVGGAGGHGLAEDDLLPLFQEEFRLPAAVVELGQQLAQLVQGDAVVDALFAAAGGGVFAQRQQGISRGAAHPVTGERSVRRTTSRSAGRAGT